MRRTLAPLPLALLLASCQVALPAAPRGAEAPAAAASRKPAAAQPGGAARPKAAAGARAIASERLDVLRPPAAAATKLVGAVRVDAAHLIASGAGRLGEQGGRQILLAGGVDLLGAGGNRVGAIGTTGEAPRATLAAGGAFFAAGGGKLIGNDGSTLIGNDGSTLIGNDGSTLMTEGKGGTLITDAGATYRLAQAGAAAPREALPAANMLVSVVSLRTREYLPLGQDAQGRPVYAVLTGADGGYEVFVPPGEERNVVVVAQVPGSTAPGLVLNALTGREAAATVDARTSSGTKLMRGLVIERLTQILSSPSRDAALLSYSSESDIPPGGRQLVSDFIDYLRGLAVRVGLRPDDDPRVAQGLAQVMSDAMLAMVDLDAPEVSTATFSTWQGSPVPALDLLDAYMIDLHTRAARYMADPTAPGGYRTLDGAWLAGINLPAPVTNGAQPLPPTPLRFPDRVVRSPADLADFAIDEFLAVKRVGIWGPLAHLFNTLDGEAPYAEPGWTQNRMKVDRMRGGLAVLSTYLVFELFPGIADGTQDPPADRKASAAAVAAAVAFDLEAARAGR